MLEMLRRQQDAVIAFEKIQQHQTYNNEGCFFGQTRKSLIIIARCATCACQERYARNSPSNV